MKQFTISFLHIYIILVLEALGFRFNSLVTYKTDVNKSINIKIHLLKGVSSKYMHTRNDNFLIRSSSRL